MLQENVAFDKAMEKVQACGVTVPELFQEGKAAAMMIMVNPALSSLMLPEFLRVNGTDHAKMDEVAITLHTDTSVVPTVLYALGVYLSGKYADDNFTVDTQAIADWQTHYACQTPEQQWALDKEVGRKITDILMAETVRCLIESGNTEGENHPHIKTTMETFAQALVEMDKLEAGKSQALWKNLEEPLQLLISQSICISTCKTTLQGRDTYRQMGTIMRMVSRNTFENLCTKLLIVQLQEQLSEEDFREVDALIRFGALTNEGSHNTEPAPVQH
ncbi:hypothetical protein [Pectobacterium phage Wc4-1]|uniref:Uncharacterized protein n=1 Tax=Pectobacterium phage Wc4 TaxID=2652428 RepID=A0A5P8D442_9CAUD|nr:hypothetical protein [Pectobacterium phage Wc4]QFP93982.1 hypothetical protein [Pectobacterium phage Wc4-1]